MKTYTYSDARKNLDLLFQEAKESGAVGIRRKDGGLYRLELVHTGLSPFREVQGVKARISREEIVSWVREGRDTGYNERL